MENLRRRCSTFITTTRIYPQKIQAGTRQRMYFLRQVLFLAKKYMHFVETKFAYNTELEWIKMWYFPWPLSLGHIQLLHSTRDQTHSNVADTTIIVVVTLLTLLTFDTAIRINYDRSKPWNPIPAILVLVSASTQQPPPPNLRFLQNIGYELWTF